MTRYLSLCLMLVGLSIAAVGCGGNTQPTDVTPKAPQEKSDIELEMESAEYEKAMNEMQ